MKMNTNKAKKITNLMINRYADMLIIKDESGDNNSIVKYMNYGLKHFNHSNLQNEIHLMLIDILRQNNSIDKWFEEQNEVFYEIFINDNDISLSLGVVMEACEQLEETNNCLTSYKDMYCEIIRLQVKKYIIKMLENIIETLAEITEKEFFLFEIEEIELIDSAKVEIEKWIKGVK